MANNGWIGVDLDGTLAMYEGWQGAEHIGAPIPPMVERVKQWLAEGREVRIFTARVYSDGAPERNQNAYRARVAIEKFCFEHLGKVLDITCIKDFAMVELWDDRAKQVLPNTGVPLEEMIGRLVGQRVMAPLLADAVQESQEAPQAALQVGGRTQRKGVK